MLAAANTPTLIETMMDYSLDSMVSNSMKFVQKDDQSWFILDETQTYGSPDPPQLGKTVNFVLGGVFIQDAFVDHMNFQCRLFGALVYNEDFPYQQDVSAGGWSYSLPFDVPGVAPSTTYYITVDAVDADGNQLFSIDTNFKFA